eukprot:TRINITY_DN7676_c0_g1_i3.p1 TRINITY_DN7676_c0_g1~~TRINITY_DN7676_c0_g1_i3.p1  ORF type:complete len:244 (-),score=41.44 TRINITY_DN7676_c0_g1_i3:224-955(-)
MAGYGSGYEDGSYDYGGMGDSFSDKSIRLGFIRKVYSILCAQLVVTMGIVGVFTIESVKVYAVEHLEMFYIALVVSLVALISLACCPDVRRKTPHNFIFLGMFTLAEGFLLGCATATYEANEVLMAVGVTAAVVLALTLFAFQTKIDFTAMGGVLLAVLVVFILFGFIAIFLPQTRTLRLVYAAIGAIIFSLYIIYDTQIMIGGKHKYSLSPEEYVFASLNLYLDIINLFLYILSIIGNSRSN